MQNCRVVATSTVGPVSTRPLFGAPKLFLAHTTTGSMTSRPWLAAMCSVIKLQDRCEDGCNSCESIFSWSS